MNKNDFIFSIAQLKEYLSETGWDLNTIKIPLLEPDKKQFYLLIPKYYVNLIDWSEPDDPLAKMVIISDLEKNIKEYELTDPIGDHSHSPVPGIIHRYPDRCLLMLTSVCAVHCRFCFRKNLLETNSAHFEKSMQYIQTHPEIWEVIFSGGDPCMLTDFLLEKVIIRLKKIPHVKMIRFHTRTPAVYPFRITKTFIEILSQASPFSIVFHINHPKEITKEFVESVNLLKSTGAILLSQTVLMKGVNNSKKTLTDLFKGLIEIGIKPYYLHHPDLAAGTDYFRVSVEEGKTLMKQLRGNISGICIPEYVIDTPGGYGKIPVFWFKHDSESKYSAVSFEGKTIHYKDYYEKN